MHIALIGYGKMGKAIEEIALQRGHQIVLKIDISNAHDLNKENLSKADVAIEFTGPDSAVENIKKCLEAGVPVVSGSTGWLDRWEEVEQYCKEQNGGLLYASNFSIGVNIFFEANRQLARLMSTRNEYNVSIEEIHHTQKKDAPSGTAITLAEGILENLPVKNKWVLGEAGQKEEISIISKRIDPAPGTHIISYDSPIDSIEIKHTAHNRTGFASGAVLAAEFMKGKKGVYGMRDVLKIN
jgi:4-hydroxy-tetrahydrodipicolinate reductase